LMRNDVVHIDACPAFWALDVVFFGHKLNLFKFLK